jgi:predicted phosphodiesterase
MSDFSKLGKTEAELKLLVNEEVGNLKKTIKEKEKLLEDYRSEHGVLESFFREVKERIEPISPVAPIYKPKKGTSKVESPCSVVMQISDTHMGEIQNSSEIEGFGSFSPEICRERCLSFSKKVIDWTYVQRSGYIIDECVVLVLGDLVSGGIHEELNNTNAYPPPVQAVESGILLSDQIALLAPHFPKIRVEFIVEDNHSRLQKKPQAKEAGLNSLNYVVGFIAKERLSKYKNLEFNIYPQLEAVVEVKGRRYLITHGHNIKSFMSIPFYGIERKVGREAVKRMNAPDFNKFHKIVMGHFHTPMTTQYYMIGGSVSGTTSYDHQCGRHAVPSQSSWAVHPSHGEFNMIAWTL